MLSLPSVGNRRTAPSATTAVLFALVLGLLCFAILK